MRSGIGWMHIKDYKHPGPVQRLDHVDEAALKNFVPAHLGYGERQVGAHIPPNSDLHFEIELLDLALRSLGHEADPVALLQAAFDDPHEQDDLCLSLVHESIADGALDAGRGRVA